MARSYQTPEYLSLSDSTKATYRGIIEGFRAAHGDKHAAMLQRDHVQTIIGAKSATPSAANNLLRMIRMLMQHALDMGLAREDPTKGIRRFKAKTTGFRREKKSISLSSLRTMPTTRERTLPFRFYFTPGSDDPMWSAWGGSTSAMVPS